MWMKQRQAYLSDGETSPMFTKCLFVQCKCKSISLSIYKRFHRISSELYKEIIQFNETNKHLN